MYNTVVETILDRGLRLLDLEFRTMTNLFSWIKRMLQNPQSTAVEMDREMTGNRIYS